MTHTRAETSQAKSVPRPRETSSRGTRTRNGRPQRPARTPPSICGAQSGMVLIASVLVMAMLSILTLAGIATSTLEVQISAHDRDSKQAFYLCEAALEKAKLGVVEGCGTGTPVGAGPGPYQFTFDAATMPDTVKGWWGTDRWVNFTLVDRRGIQYGIDSHHAVLYQITACSGPLDPPNAGAVDRANIYYKDDNPVVDFGTGTLTAANTFTPAVALAQDYTDFAFRDSAGDVFKITNQNTMAAPWELTLDGDPADGAFEIWRFVGDVDSFTVYANTVGAGDWTGAPNPEWWSNGTYDFSDGPWYLRDRNETYFEILSTTRDTTGRNHVVLGVSGTPASGAFQLVTNPWLVEKMATPQTWSFDGVAGTTYGDVDVTVQNNGDPEQFVMAAVSTSTATGNVKEIRIDAELAADGQVELSNWRQVR